MTRGVAHKISTQSKNLMFQCHFKWIVKYYLTAYPAVYGQFPQAIPQPIAAVPAQREGKKH